MKCAPPNIASTASANAPPSTGSWAITISRPASGTSTTPRSTGRRWYPFSAANNDLTPYDVPRNPAFTQYDVTLRTDDVQLHLQDQWHITPDLTAAGRHQVQPADGRQPCPGQQQNLQAAIRGLPATSPQVVFPTGSITSNDWFLPQAGATWDATDSEQVFVNVQENLRQFVPYAAGSNFYGASPWSLGSQAAFDTFKADGASGTLLDL